MISNAPAIVPLDMLATIICNEQTLRIPLNKNKSLRQVLDTTETRVRAACGGLGTCGACLIQTVDGEFNPPTLAERQKLLPEDLAIGMRLACQLKARSDCTLFLEHPAPHSVWKSMDTSLLYQAVANPMIDKLIYGVAVDLGTTHIRLSLWNRQSGRRIGSRYSINPQVAHGADVLTRLDADRLSEDTCHRIGQQARSAIIDGIRDILSRDLGEITTVLNELGKALIVGNTAMLTLICGNNGDDLYQPENWQSPIACHPDDCDAWRQIWRTPHADITIAQPLAGFIGSDLLADLLATGLTEQSQPMLLADFGTNTEIAVWDGNRLWVSSVPGGPAFEGVGMRCGLPAEAGAICKVTRTADAWQLVTLEDIPARGYCASGFIDAISLMLEAELLKPSGRFVEPQFGNGYSLDPNNPRTAIFASDIDIFQRAKASTAAAMARLLALAGLTINDLKRLWICGSFGRQLNLNSALRVGLLPPVAMERVSLLADASLAGCEKLLLDPHAERQLRDIVQRTQVINLGSDFEYENRFIDNLRLRPMTVEG